MDITSAQKDRHSANEFARLLDVLIDTGVGVLHVKANEPLRALPIIRRQILKDNGEYAEWDIVNGNRTFQVADINKHAMEGDNNPDFSASFRLPMGVLRDAENSLPSAVMKFYVYVNPHPFMENNPEISSLLTIYCNLLPASNVCVIIVTPDVALPGDFSGATLSLDLTTPGIAELRDCLDEVLEDVEDKFSNLDDIDDEDRNRICYVGAGLTRSHFETYVSLAIVKAGRDGKTVLSVEDIIKEVSVGKTDVVNANDILELYPSGDIDTVGGMDNLKDWVRKRAKCYSDDARDFGVEPPKGMVFVGPPGCLDGSTEVQYRRGVRNSGRTITLESLFYKFNGMQNPMACRGEATPWRDVTLPTYLHSLDEDGTVFYNRIVSVIEAGRKAVTEVEVDSGEVIRLTETHPVCTPGGAFVEAGRLKTGDSVLMRGSMLPVGTGGRKLDARPPRRIENVKYHPYGSTKVVDGYEYKRIAYARLVVEAHMNRVPVDEFVHALKNNPHESDKFRYLPPEYEVHHVDEDSMNDELHNLMVLTREEHARLHGKVENFNVEYVREATVVSVRSLPARMTYDVQMDMPANNFVANGFIVHNTGKSLAAKAIASVLGVPLVRLDFGRVFNSLVGASEQRMRTALKMVESMSPCVLFCDEIDKGLGGIGGSSDGGTSNRVLGSFLTWLQDCEFPVFTMVTANNVTGLPPELLRRGRFDAIFATGLPKPEERREVLRIHLSKRGRDLDDFEEDDIQAVIDASNKYVPAEIESAVKDALVDAFDADEELTMGHIRRALSVMVPLSKSFETQIAEMADWAKSNATPASSDAAHKRQTETQTANRSRRAIRRRTS